MREWSTRKASEKWRKRDSQSIRGMAREPEEADEGRVWKFLEEGVS